MGVQIAHIYGGSYMLNIYLAGALAGSLGHMAYCAILVPWIEVQIFEKYDYVDYFPLVSEYPRYLG